VYSDWQAAAKAAIQKVHESLPEDADLKQRRAALLKAALQFHGGTSWGKKTWSKHTRIYLQKHGLPLRTPENSPLFADDIIFPFREQQ
jgi:hypothetical protein